MESDNSDVMIKVLANVLNRLIDVNNKVRGSGRFYFPCFLFSSTLLLLLLPIRLHTARDNQTGRDPVLCPRLTRAYKSHPGLGGLRGVVG